MPGRFGRGFLRRPRDSRSAAVALDDAGSALDAGDATEALRSADRAVAAARAAGVAAALLAAALTVRAGALVELERFADAERTAADACSVDAAGADAWFERAVAAYRLGWFEAAEEHAREAVERDPENADAWHLLGRALVWRVRRPEADEALRRAAALDPQEYARPVRIATGEFDRIAAEVWRAIPGRFRQRMGNTLVVAAELPDPDEVSEGFDPDTLGVYEGGTALHGDGPERIVLFQRNLETICGSLGELAEEVRRTLLHEVGHHFGMDEGELPY